MVQYQDEVLDKVFAALSDPTRRPDIGGPVLQAAVEIRANMIEQMVGHLTNPRPAAGARKRGMA